jgi:hypothetical protein
MFLKKITVNQKIFIPMIAKRFEIEESNSYDSLTDETFEEFTKNPQNLMNSTAPEFHRNKS